MMNFLLGVPQKETTVMEDEEEALYYEMPEYMDIAPCEMFKTEIVARREYAQFVNNEIPELEQYLNNFIQKYSTQNSVGWIGGSRAWKRVYEQTFSHEPLDLLTESAILSAGNYDIFMIFNNKDLMVRSFSKIKEEVTKLVNTIKLKLVDNYTVEIKYVKGQTMKPEDKLEMCALFPCKSIAVEITSNIDSNSRRKKPNSVISRASSSSTNSMNSITTTTSSSCDSVLLQKTPPKVNEKLLLYIEISYMSDVDINLFRTEFLNDNYLNPKGLFLFSQFLKNPRTDKGINVDVLRENFIQTVIGKETSVASLSYQMADKYNEIFGTHYNFHVKFLNYLYMKAVYKLHEEQQQYDIEQFYTFYVMETLRPMINTCVGMLSNILKEEYKNAFLLIVGGDAMRRYKSDITKTSDIDTKLYYDKTMTVSKVTSLVNTILAFMSLFTVLLNNTYKLDQTNVYTLESKSKADYTVYLPKLRLFDDKETLDYTRNKNSIIINNFRLRYIEASYEFPVNLFSIDFNVPVVINILNKKQQFRSHITIPVFDLVLQETTHTNTSNIVHNSAHSVVPVASLAFLKEDIRNTYSNVSKTKMRFNNDKVKKDDRRLDELEQLDESDYNNKLDVLFDNKYLILDNKNDIRLHIKSQATEYLKKIKGAIAKNHRKHILKHKLPFRRSKIDDIEVSSANYDFENNIYRKINMTSFVENSNTIYGGKNKMNGEKILNYIKMRNNKLYKLIKFRKIKLENSLPLDKYILEYLYN